jgi:hypothetical protein
MLHDTDYFPCRARLPRFNLNTANRSATRLLAATPAHDYTTNRTLLQFHHIGALIQMLAAGQDDHQTRQIVAWNEKLASGPGEMICETRISSQLTDLPDYKLFWPS